MEKLIYESFYLTKMSVQKKEEPLRHKEIRKRF